MSEKNGKKIENIFLGASAATVLKTAKAPLERIKFLLQCQNELIRHKRRTEPFKGIIGCTKQIFKAEGLLSFWRGNLITCMNYFPKQGIYILVLEDVKTVFKPNSSENYAINFAKTIASGSVAGAITLAGIYPIDFIRTQMIADVKHGEKYQYKGITDVIVKTWKKSGFFGFYRGYFLSCIGVMVYRGCYFGLYDILKPMLGKTPRIYPLMALGYGVVITSSLLSYPIDTIRRRLMIASVQDLKYKGAVDCLKKIISNEGLKPLMHGFGASIFTAVFGTFVLVGYNTYLQPFFKAKITTE